jgi:hypothetical protein
MGYEYVDYMVDDHSRLSYSEILAGTKGPCASFIVRAADTLRDNALH